MLLKISFSSYLPAFVLLPLLHLIYLLALLVSHCEILRKMRTSDFVKIWYFPHH